jgi:hypothetical protein
VANVSNHSAQRYADARRLVRGCVGCYNNVRLNSAVGCITQKDMLAGSRADTRARRDGKLEEDRKTATFVVRRLREERRATLTIADETHNFRVADHSGAVPRNPPAMKLRPEIPPLLLRAEEIA